MVGTWGAGAFDNDDAADWLCELYDSDSVSNDLIETTLSTVANAAPSAYLEFPACCRALAANEILAARMGKPSTELPDEARRWLNEHALEPSQELRCLAFEAIERIERSSELKNLWSESDSSQEWYQAIGDLKKRLGADPS